jgi:hypothetical protein
MRVASVSQHKLKTVAVIQPASAALARLPPARVSHSTLTKSSGDARQTARRTLTIKLGTFTPARSLYAEREHEERVT